MTLRVTLGPFTLVTVAAVLVFGVIIPLAESIYGVSADTGRPSRGTREAEWMVSQSWPDVQQCLELGRGGVSTDDRFVLKANIDAAGIVRSVTVVESPEVGGVLNTCLLRIVRAWRFQPSPGDRSIVLVFDPSQHAFDTSFDASAP